MRTSKGDTVSANGHVLRPRDLVQVTATGEYGYVEEVLSPRYSTRRILVMFYSESPGAPPRAESRLYRAEELGYVKEESDEDL